MMRVLCSDRRVFECLRDAFSDDNDAAFYVAMHGFSIDEKVYLVNQFGYFRPGLLFEILSYIRTNFGDLSCVHMSEQCRDYVNEYLTPFRRYLKGVGSDGFDVLNIADETVNVGRPEVERLKLRDYQEEAIRKVILDGYGRGLVELPTSAGKSFVIANLIYTVDRNVMKGLRYLIFVPNRQLVDQFYKDLLSYGFPDGSVTRLSSGLKGRDAFDPSARVIVSNRQYVFRNAEKLPKVDFLINDEVHQGKPNSSTIRFVDDLDCRFKVGFSATIPRRKYDRLSLVGSFGRVLYVKEITDLQSRGYISSLRINLIRLVDRKVAADRSLLFHEHSKRRFNASDMDGIRFNEAYEAETKYVTENYATLYAPILDELGNLEGNTLVLFDRLEFGQGMFELAKSKGWSRKVRYIDGQTPIAEREESRSLLEGSNDNVLFGQCSILSTGINIRNLTNLVLMVSTKSFSRILQSIGRTLRLHRDKDHANLYDISFNFKYSQKHLAERLAIYRQMYHKSPDSTKTIEFN